MAFVSASLATNDDQFIAVSHYDRVSGDEASGDLAESSDDDAEVKQQHESVKPTVVTRVEQQLRPQRKLPVVSPSAFKSTPLGVHVSQTQEMLREIKEQLKLSTQQQHTTPATEDDTSISQLQSSTDVDEISQKEQELAALLASARAAQGQDAIGLSTSMQEALDQSRRQNRALRAELDEAHANIDAEMARRVRAEQERDEASLALTELQIKLSKAANIDDAITERIRASEAETASLRAQLQAKLDSSINVEDPLVQIREEINALQQRRAEEFYQHITELQDELDKSILTNAELQGAVDDLKVKLSVAEAERDRVLLDSEVCNCDSQDSDTTASFPFLF